MSDAAKTWWNKLAPGLIAAEVLTSLDTTGLRLLCQTLAEIDACEATIAVEGLTIRHMNKAGAENVVPHPLVKIRNTARVAATQLMKGLAMVPAVRGVRGITPQSASDLKLFTMTDEELQAEATINPNSAAAAELNRRQFFPDDDPRSYFA